MPNVVGSKDQLTWKPKQFKNYLTMGELCAKVNRDRRRITQLEAEGRIGAPIRVKVGRLQSRLYSPEEVARIEEHFKTNGRKR